MFITDVYSHIEQTHRPLHGLNPHENIHTKHKVQNVSWNTFPTLGLHFSGLKSPCDLKCLSNDWLWVAKCNSSAQNAKQLTMASCLSCKNVLFIQQLGSNWGWIIFSSKNNQLRRHRHNLFKEFGPLEVRRVQYSHLCKLSAPRWKTNSVAIITNYTWKVRTPPEISQSSKLVEMESMRRSVEQNYRWMSLCHLFLKSNTKNTSERRTNCNLALCGLLSSLRALQKEFAYL